MRNKSRHKKSQPRTGVKQYLPNPDLPIADAVVESIEHMRALELVSSATIDTYKDRVFGSNGDGIGMVVFRAARIDVLSEISLTSIRLVNKYIGELRNNPNGRNAIKTAIRQVFENLNDLGLTEIPDSWFKCLRLEKTQPPEPVTFSWKESEIILQTRVGNNSFEILRNSIIVALIIERGIRPGKEIIGIKNSDVHMDQCYFDFERKYKVIHRCYVRRDLADKIMEYQQLRDKILKRRGLKTDRFFIDIN